MSRIIHKYTEINFLYIFNFQYQMYEKNVLLHYLNLEYRRIVGLPNFYSIEKTKELLHKINYVAILLCEEYCMIPYSTLVEDDIISELFIKKRYSDFFEAGLIRVALRDSSPEEFLDKKKSEYNSNPELYGYFKKGALKKLKQHDILIIKRDYKIGTAIQERWKNEIEEYANASIWRDVLLNKNDNLIEKQLKEIPNRIIEEGKGIIWPLVDKLLNTDNTIKKSKIREILLNLYFSNFVNDQAMVIITDLIITQNNFLLDYYKGQNYSYFLYDRFTSQINIRHEIYTLSSFDLIQLKNSSEYQTFIYYYHNLLGPILNKQQALNTLNHLNNNLGIRRIINSNKNRLGLEKIFFTLEQINRKLDIETTLNISDSFYSNYSTPTIKSNIKFDIGILTALHEDEFENVELYIGNGWDDGKIIDSTKVYLTSEVQRQDCKLNIIGSYQVNTGMVEAGIFATEIINRFKPKYLIMPGVLAGKPDKSNLDKSDLNFGDIIVATKLFTFEKGKHSEEGYENDLDVVNIDSKLIQLIRLKKEAILGKIKHDLLLLKMEGVSILNHFEVSNLNIHIAPIACSLSVVNKTGEFAKKVTPLDRKAKGLEMESFGIAKACEISNNGETKALIVKSVMDKSENKDDNNKKIAALTSALFVKHLIDSVLIF